MTIVYRSDPKLLKDYNKYKNKRDAALIYSILKNGKGYLMEESMGVYRIHNGGIWSGVEEAKRWESEFSVRSSIYDVEQSNIAAAYLARCLRINTVSRKYFLKKRKEVAKIAFIVRKHFGIKETVNLLFFMMFKINLFGRID